MNCSYRAAIKERQFEDKQLIFDSSNDVNAGLVSDVAALTLNNRPICSMNS